MAGHYMDGQHSFRAYGLMGLGPVDHYEEAGGGGRLDDISPAGVPGWVEQGLGWRYQIALSKH